MAIFIPSLIAVFLAVGETSFMPFFKLFGVVPFVTLAFISLLAVRYRGFFHFILAFFLGVYFDAISGAYPGLFVAVFVTTVIIGRAFFYRDTGYDAEKSYFWLLSGAAGTIFLIQSTAITLNGFSGWKTFLFRSLVGTILTLITGMLIYHISDKFLDWLNKMNEEKYR